MVKFKGLAKVQVRFQRLANADKLMLAGLAKGGVLIANEAKRSIVEGSISGAGHVPSLPGEPPNADTHELDLNIYSEVRSVSPPKVEVISAAPHAVPMEIGTSKTAARPYMQPAAKKMLSEIVEAVANELKGKI